MPISLSASLLSLPRRKNPTHLGTCVFGSIQLSCMVYAGRNIKRLMVDYGLVGRISAGPAGVCLWTASTRLKLRFAPAPPVTMPLTIDVGQRSSWREVASGRKSERKSAPHQRGRSQPEVGKMSPLIDDTFNRDLSGLSSYFSISLFLFFLRRLAAVSTSLSSVFTACYCSTAYSSCAWARA